MFKYNHLTKVYYRDVDQMGIVYYTRYLEYFEEARTELLDSLGLTISIIENKGIQLPVIVSHCEYKKGAELEQIAQTIEVGITGSSMPGFAHLTENDRIDIAKFILSLKQIPD